MNKMKRITVFGLCLSLVFTLFSGFVGCSEKDSPVEEGGIGVIETENEEDKYLTRAFSTEYKIVIAENASSTIDTAAEELQDFLKKSSGATLPIVSDAGLTYGENNKYISLGNTTILSEAKIENSYDELGYSGYKINTKGLQIIISGATETGVLYGVYGLLDQLIDFEAYAIDEVYYRTLTTICVPDYKNYVHVPAIDVKFMSNGAVDDLENQIALARMGLISSYWFGWTLDGIYFGAGLNVHSMFKVLNPQVYQADHPDWYWSDADGKALELCLTNEEMKIEFIKRLKAIIAETPNSKYYNLGNEDNTQVCGCDACSAYYEKYGRAAGAGYIYANFLNSVSEEIDAWIAEEYPERIGEVFIGGLAYFGYNTPPTIYNTATGEHTPIDDSVILRDSVFMQFCTHDSCMAHALNDEACDYNARFYRNLNGWSKLSKHMKIYSYTACMDELFMYFNDYNAWTGNMKLFKELHVDYISLEGNKNEEGPFDSLRMYIFSKLADDPTQDFDTLVRSFINHYYKDAAPQVYTFYRNLRDNYVVTARNNNQNICLGLYTYNPYMEVYKNHSSYWSYEFLDNSMNLFAAGFDAIEAGDYNNAQKVMLSRRMLQLEVPIRYFLIKHYSNYYPADKLEEIKNEFLKDATYAGWVKNSIFSGNSITF